MMNLKRLLLCVVLITLHLTLINCADDDYVDVEDEEPLTDEPKVARVKPDYKVPKPQGNTFFVEPFESKEDFAKRWITSEAKKEDTDDNIAKYDGKWAVEEAAENALAGDLSLVLKSKAKHHAVSAKLSRPYDFAGKSLIISYEVKFQNGIECGGAYIKLLTREPRLDLKQFHDKTPYTIMFGPDKCGLDYKLHFIFRHKNLKTGKFEEKHAKKYTGKIEDYFTDKKTHLYTLIITPDNGYQILIDKTVVNKGNLLEDFTPPVNPPEEIEDPNDKKPSDWDEREKIADPDAFKPDDWDESEPEMIEDPDAVKPVGWLDDVPELIPDPDADKPSDWDEDMDGEWEAPLINNPKCADASGCGSWTAPNIKNPKYKGKWTASMIDNPNYKGIWKPQKIKNPDYFEDTNPYKMAPIAAVGLELWSMSDDIAFDNFLITDDQAVADTWHQDSWDIKSTEERASDTVGRTIIQAIKDQTHERPWLWAVFIVVVLLPIVLIIAYCCMSTPEQGIWHTLKSSADQRPWLWAVYIVVILLPIFLLSICLCPKSGPITPEDIAASKKKTDEPSPDDDEEGDDDDSDDKAKDDIGGGGDNPASAKKASKTDLEVENNDGEDADVEDEPASKDTPGDSQSPRRRKVRKE